MNDMDAAELIDRLDTPELLVLADEFGIFASIQNRRIASWSSWWLWRMMRAMGDDHPQPPGELVDVMYGNEREGVKKDLLALAERHRLDDGVVAFCSGMVAQIDFRQLEDEVDKEELRDSIAQSRERINRERAEGKRPAFYFGDGVR
jgi:hypothetical protein